jgi:predicted small integral membrane protein
MNLEWMAWTQVTAIFFLTIALILIAMTLAELRVPTVERQGFLPMPTTRGDRLFLSLLLAAFINLGFVAFTDVHTLWIPLSVSVLAALVMMRFG